MPGVYTIGLDVVNTFLIDDGDLVLVDTGIAGSEIKILQAVPDLGRQPSDIIQIILTHCYPDLSGDLARLKADTGVLSWMYPTDAALV